MSEENSMNQQAFAWFFHYYKKCLEWGKESLDLRTNKQASLWLGVVLAVVIAVVAIKTVVQSNTVDLLVDMEVQAGTEITVYVNKNYQHAYHLPLLPNSRQVYHFKNMPANLFCFWMDPTNAPKTELKVYNLRTERKGKLIKSFDPQTLLGWIGPDVPRQVKDEYLYIPLSDQNPAFYCETELTKTNGIIEVFDVFYTSHVPWLVLGLLGIVILLIFGRKEDWADSWLPFGMVVLLGVLAGPIANLVLSGSGAIWPVDRAVGYASYIGLEKSLENNAFLTILVMAIGLGVLGWGVLRWRFAEHASGSQQPVAAKVISYKFLGILIAIFLLFGFPPIRQTWDGLFSTTHVPHWDHLNNLTWKYLVHQGWLPFRDFWFPYGGFYNKVSPFPADLFRLHVHNLIVFTAFITAVYFLVNKSKLWTLCIVLLVFIPFEYSSISKLNRYFLSLNAVLLFAALTRVRATWWAYLLYGGYVGWTFTFNPVQLIYAGLPVLVLMGLHLFSETTWQARLGFIRKLSIAGAMFFSVVLMYGLVLVAKGQWSGFLALYTQLGSAGTYGAIPANIQNWLVLKFANENILLYSILFSVLLGVYLRLRVREGMGEVLIAIGLLGTMIFQKQLLRPSMAHQILGIFLVAFGLYLYDISKLWTERQKKMIIVIVLACVVLWLYTGQLQKILRKYGENILALPSSIGMLIHDKREIERGKENFFSPDSFQHYPAVREFMEYYKNTQKQDLKAKFYVLGDEPHFYILSQQKPPQHICLYSASVLSEQQGITQWLDSNQVEYVIWNPTFTHFDQVPNPVRVPLIYNYVITHYAPHDTFDEYQVLKRRDPEQPMDLAFWTKHMGDTVDVHSLAQIGNGTKLPDAAESEAERIYQVLTIQTTGVAEDKKRTVEFTIGEQKFVLAFHQKKEITEYSILLNRIWFWEAAESAGLNITIAEEQDSDLQLDILEKVAQDTILY
jgi:hypothetical protein